MLRPHSLEHGLHVLLDAGVASFQHHSRSRGPQGTQPLVQALIGTLDLAGSRRQHDAPSSGFDKRLSSHDPEAPKSPGDEHCALAFTQPGVMIDHG